MRILVINKFIYPKGGAETVALQVGEELARRGHTVEYFGIQGENGEKYTNSLGLYATPMDFHTNHKLEAISYSSKIIYNKEIKDKVVRIIKNMDAQIVHCHNINFQLTSAVLDAAKECNVPIVWTVHDFQLMCPNHLFLHNGKICEECYLKTGPKKYAGCLKNKCIHGSMAKSIIGVVEAKRNYAKGKYEGIAEFICPSKFMQEKLEGDNSGLFKNTEFIQNYVKEYSDEFILNKNERKGYGLFFGRFYEEKGIRYLMENIKNIDHEFRIAGSGPMEDYIKECIKASGNPNLKLVGFKSGEDLIQLIREADYAVYPSTFYENCPMSILEAISLGTPIFGNDVGGISELLSGIDNCLYKNNSINGFELKETIKNFYGNEEIKDNLYEEFKKKRLSLNTLETYTDKLEDLYSNVLLRKD